MKVAANITGDLKGRDDAVYNPSHDNGFVKVAITYTF